MEFDPTSITPERLQEFRNAAETAWGDDTRHADAQGHPQSAYGQCFVTSAWLVSKLGGHVGMKNGHYVWVSPDKQYVIDLTGDQTAYRPHTGANAPMDEEDEPYEFEPHQLEHRAGPAFYTRSSHPLYRDLRVKEYPSHPRATLFAKRANAALAGKLPRKHAAPGEWGDAYPGQEPQAEEDFHNKYFHDTLSDLQLTLEEPDDTEYRWFYGNGQLHVSPVHSHDELRDHSGTPANHSGPIAAGFVHVRGRDAIWSAESNIALTGLKGVLEDYGKAVGWDWGGLVGGDGQLFADDFGPKKSVWYGWQDGVQISERPFFGSLGRIVVTGHTVDVGSVPDRVRPGVAEWANDFGYRVAEYPGGGDATDKIKSKEWPMTYDHGNPDAPEPEPGFDGVPEGELTCPYCKAILPNYREYVVHTQDHQSLNTEEIPDGHFPTTEEDVALPLRNRNTEPTAQPLLSFREASLVPDFDLYSGLWGFSKDDYRFYGGYLEGQLVGYGVVDPKDSTVIMVHSAVPARGVGTAILRRILLHYPNARSGAVSTEGERLMERCGMIEVEKGLWKTAAEQEPKDLIQAALPFVYDIQQDHIAVGHPGQKTSDIMGQFTPGGIVEGYYEPGGKVIIQTTTTMPYSTYHLMQLWYYSHPQLEITGLELETAEGKPQKLAATSVGHYIKTLTATDAAAWTAYQALRSAGGHCYVVGGAVRDALLQKEPKDIDLMVAGLPPEDVQQVLSKLPGEVILTGARFGVYRYKTKGQEVEIALPRMDSYGDEGTRGTGQITVDHNLPVEQDLQRRDFTVNSMAVDLESGALIDPYDGSKDIERGVLRTTHPNSYKEDPTRLVRALVASSRHGLLPDEKTRHEMEENSYRLDQESPDALKQQLDKLLTSPNPAGAIRLAQETGVLKHLFPELANNFDYQQNNKHHAFSLGEHSLQVLDNMAQKTTDPDMRLAALLHDVGKPGSEWVDPQTGEKHFYAGQINGQPVGADHAQLGANAVESNLRSTFNYPVARLRRVHNLISNHMWAQFSSPKGARKFLNQQGDMADDQLTLREADTEGKGTDVSYKTSVEQMRNLVEQARTMGAPTNQSMLSVNGNDLIDLGLQGAAIGRVLRQLTNDVVAEGPAANDREYLLERAREYANATA